jgi:hypothetical protein
MKIAKSINYEKVFFDPTAYCNFSSFSGQVFKP